VGGEEPPPKPERDATWVTKETEGKGKKDRTTHYQNDLVGSGESEKNSWVIEKSLSAKRKEDEGKGGGENLSNIALSKA